MARATMGWNGALCHHRVGVAIRNNSPIGRLTVERWAAPATWRPPGRLEGDLDLVEGALEEAASISRQGDAPRAESRRACCWGASSLLCLVILSRLGDAPCSDAVVSLWWASARASTWTSSSSIWSTSALGDAPSLSLHKSRSTGGGAFLNKHRTSASLVASVRAAWNLDGDSTGGSHELSPRTAA